MGPLAAAFKAFTDRWPTAQSISQNPNAFATEARGVLTALTARIRRENVELYDLIDRS
jgi:hypothetical protein